MAIIKSECLIKEERVRLWESIISPYWARRELSEGK